MTSRTISLAEDAYQALSGARRPGESFSDVVRRLAPRRSLTELAGILTPQAAQAVAHAIAANRHARASLRRKELGLD